MKDRTAQTRNTHKTIALRSAGVLISDNDSFQDLAELLEVATKRLVLRFPSQAPDKYLGVGRVPEGGIRELEARIRTRSRSRIRPKSHDFPVEKTPLEKTQMLDFGLRAGRNSRYDVIEHEHL